MLLKNYFRTLLAKAMIDGQKSQADIVKNTSHSHAYVSTMLKTDTNHCFDTAEKIAAAIGCKIEIKLIPMTDAEEIAKHKELSHIEKCHK